MADAPKLIDDFDAEARAAASKSLAASVSRAHGVRAFPMSTRRLLDMLRDPKIPVDPIAETIESDGALAARVLRVVNSPIFGLRVRVRRIRVAVTLLGRKYISEIATAAAVLDWFADDSQMVSEIFRHSAATAAIGRQIALRTALSSEELYTSGLLHDFGKLMLIESGDDGYAEILTRSAGHPDQVHLLEREAYGFDHAVLGGQMFAEWNIPEPLPSIIALHHQPERAFAGDDSNLGRMVAALRWAESMAHAFANGAQPDAAWFDALAQTPEVVHLGVARGQLPELVAELQAAYADGHTLSPFGGDAEHVEPDAGARSSSQSLPPPRPSAPPAAPSGSSPSLTPPPAVPPPPPPAPPPPPQAAERASSASPAPVAPALAGPPPSPPPVPIFDADVTLEPLPAVELPSPAEPPMPPPRTPPKAPPARASEPPPPPPRDEVAKTVALDAPPPGPAVNHAAPSAPAPPAVPVASPGRGAATAVFLVACAGLAVSAVGAWAGLPVVTSVANGVVALALVRLAAMAMAR